MTPESRNNSLLGNGSLNIFPRKRKCATIEKRCLLGVSEALVAMQRCGKHISAAVNQHATIEEPVFSVGAAPRLHNEDLRQLELRTELSFGIPSRGLRS
jgi:hypothetical protein